MNILKKALYKFFPPYVLYYILDLRETISQKRKMYYSQFGEDIILQDLTKNQEKGFYIDVGANHPIKSSNTYLLYKRGWSGINIEADPFLCSLLKRYRSRDINVGEAVGKAETEATYYRFADSRISTFSKERADELIQKGWKLVEEISIPTHPLNSILSKYDLPPVDILTIDIEDMDQEALETNDWSKVNPRIVVIESRGFDASRPQEDWTYRFLTERGYIFYSRAGYSLFFTKQS